METDRWVSTSSFSPICQWIPNWGSFRAGKQSSQAGLFSHSPLSALWRVSLNQLNIFYLNIIRHIHFLDKRLSWVTSANCKLCSDWGHWESSARAHSGFGMGGTGSKWIWAAPCAHRFIYVSPATGMRLLGCISTGQRENIIYISYIIQVLFIQLRHGVAKGNWSAATHWWLLIVFGITMCGDAFL